MDYAFLELSNSDAEFYGNNARNSAFGLPSEPPLLFGNMNSDVTVTVHQTPDAESALSVTLLKASLVRGRRSSSDRNALSVANQRRSWTSKPGEKDREFLRASEDRSIR